MYRAFNDLKEMKSFIVQQTGLKGLNVEVDHNLIVEPAYAEVRILDQTITTIFLEVAETAGTRAQEALVLFDENELDKLKTISDNVELIKALATEDHVNMIDVGDNVVNFDYALTNQVSLTLNSIDVDVEIIQADKTLSKVVEYDVFDNIIEIVKEMICSVDTNKIN